MFILLVDAEPSAMTALNLQCEGHVVETMTSGGDAISFAREFEIDAAVVDTAPPDMSSYALLSGLRSRRPRLTLIVLSALSSVKDKVEAFANGADDYLVKPCDERELIARLVAVNRRWRGEASDIVRIGNLEVDLADNLARVDGKTVHFPNGEFKILAFLCLSPGTFVNRDAIMDHLYGRVDNHPGVKILDSLVCRIRGKLARASGGLNYIATRYGCGYAARDPVARRYDAENAERAA